MSSKWKYAGLDTKHRLALLENGNKELFDEEVARTKEIVDARRELGLDTTAEEKWMDEVGYSYSLSLVDEGTPVSKTGYAKLYLDGKTPDTEMSVVKAGKLNKPSGGSYISAAKSKIDKAMKLALDKTREKYDERKKTVKDEIYDKYPHLKEQLINEGASLGGGKIGKMYELLEKELSDAYALLDTKLEQDLQRIGKKYSGFKDEISEYRRNGTALESLGVIADVLIKNAAIEDEFDYSDIPGLGVKVRVKNSGTSAKDDAETETSAGKKPVTENGYKASDDDEYEEESQASDKDIVYETEDEGDTLSDVLHDSIGTVANQAQKNPEKAVKAVTEMLVLGGLSTDDAWKSALELVKLLIGRGKAGNNKASTSASGM